MITGSNQLWEMDIKYGNIERDRFFFVLSIIDVYNRNIVGYHIGLSCKGTNAVQAVKQALLKRKQFNEMEKPVIRTDN